MKTTTLNLSGGRLVLGPLLAATLRDNKERLAAANAGQITDPFEMLELTCTLAHAAAKRVNPNVTLEDVEHRVDLENVAEVYAACWGAAMPTRSGEPPPEASPAA